MQEESRGRQIRSIPIHQDLWCDGMEVASSTERKRKDEVED